jgi:hypothetical protein
MVQVNPLLMRLAKSNLKSPREDVALLSGFYLKPWEPGKVEKDLA